MEGSTCSIPTSTTESVVLIITHVHVSYNVKPKVTFVLLDVPRL